MIGSAVCFVGMHRSGTSMIARVANLLGVYLGREDELLAPQPDNIAGFWEHAAIMHFNEAILRQFGGSWSSVPRLPEGWVDESGLAPIREQSRQALAASFDGQSLWGWKDPRCSITLPFWQALVPNLRVVICVRHPEAVARSLSVRDGLPIERSLRLWTEHMAGSVKHSAGIPRLVSCYEDYFEGFQETERLARFLGLDEALEDPATRERIQASIRTDLRHHRPGARNTKADRQVPGSIRTLHLALRQHAAVGAPADELLDASVDGAMDTLRSADVADAFGAVAMAAPSHRTIERERLEALADRESRQRQHDELVAVLRSQLQTVAANGQVAEDERARALVALQAARRRCRELEERLAAAEPPMHHAD
jgi:hypothetical protein